jgi:NAD(P)-dependent dehydrogenase (short-subunit alcohol dehydrogenase family)
MVGSVDGIRPDVTDTYAYSASQAAIHMLTRHLARRLAPEHITVNAIAPGPFPSRLSAYMLDDPTRRADVVSRVPLGRVGGRDEAAGPALLLASPAGAFLTGVVIPVDGGITGCC